MVSIAASVHWSAESDWCAIGRFLRKHRAFAVRHAPFGSSAPPLRMRDDDPQALVGPPTSSRLYVPSCCRQFDQKRIRVLSLDESSPSRIVSLQMLHPKAQNVEPRGLSASDKLLFMADCKGNTVHVFSIIGTR